MAKKILAVSGGVDSMVMLDLVSRSGKFPLDELVVAHFDHGIRANSAEDAEFVEAKSREYGLDFYSERAELGEGASEAEARQKRYEFFAKVAEQIDDGRGVEIWTAHHLDDLVESVLINLARGTGWRGLAVLDTAGVRRPFLETEMFYEPMDRAAIFEYAAKRRLEYREDPSNSWDEYLRNRIRHEMNNSPLNWSQKLQIYELWQAQKVLRAEIDNLVNGMLPTAGEVWQRSWFQELDTTETTQKVALELLRAGTLRAGIAATRPQLEDFRQAILKYLPGKSFNLPEDNLVKFTKTDFKL